MERLASEDDIAAFRRAFRALQENDPFPWQERLFGMLVSGKIPSALDLPTGLGKTSVMAIWLIARALAGDEARRRLPRRLVYVVDRRAVVDQATEAAERIRKELSASELDSTKLGLGKGELPISTLRGQHADNRSWLANPTASAIIVGTVDMIGSRLGFSGYGVSRKMRPFHAGFLGADALLVLDEAHLVPPFRHFLQAIERDKSLGQSAGNSHRDRIPPFQLMSLSATGGHGEEIEAAFRLADDDHAHAVVAERLDAPKRLTILEDFEGKAALVDQLVERAWRLGAGPTPARVLVYCNSRGDALKIRDAIAKRAKNLPVGLLVGQRRVRERDCLFQWLKENGFLGGLNESPPSLPTFLIATAAGEVGIDLDADHMVCDLVEWERMVQRLGRVNRRGRKQAMVEVVALPSRKQAGDESWEDRSKRLRAPLELLPPQEGGAYDASPGAIMKLKDNPAAVEVMRKAGTEEPLRPLLTRAVVDAWSMTSLADHAGRPDIQPWLRGWQDEDPQCTVVWREHLPVRVRGSSVIWVDGREINDFFEAAPPHLTETLEAETWAVADWLFKRVAAAVAEAARREKAGGTIAVGKESHVLFVLDGKDEFVEAYTLAKLDNLEGRNRDRFVEGLSGCTLIVSKQLGGLEDGMLRDQSVESFPTMDTDPVWPTPTFRVYETDKAGPVNEDRWKRSHHFASRYDAEGDATSWLVVDESVGDPANEEARALSRKQTLREHSQWVESVARDMAHALGLPLPYAEMLALAARWHDEGKDQRNWRLAFGVPVNGEAFAKTRRFRPALLGGYRHEFGSLRHIEGNLDVQQEQEFRRLPCELRDLLLHLVAAHHGNARPLIAVDGCEGQLPDLEASAQTAMLRFERLQQQWGPWGLAWWESLLRAADQEASRRNDLRGKTGDGT